MAVPSKTASRSGENDMNLLFLHHQLHQRILEEEERLQSTTRAASAQEVAIPRPMFNSILLGSALLQDTSGTLLPAPRLPPPGLSKREQLLFHINDALAIMDEDEDLFGEDAYDEPMTFGSANPAADDTDDKGDDPSSSCSL